MFKNNSQNLESEGVTDGFLKSTVMEEAMSDMDREELLIEHGIDPSLIEKESMLSLQSSQRKLMTSNAFLEQASISPDTFEREEEIQTDVFSEEEENESTISELPQEEMMRSCIACSGSDNSGQINLIQKNIKMAIEERFFSLPIQVPVSQTLPISTQLSQEIPIFFSPDLVRYYWSDRLISCNPEILVKDSGPTYNKKEYKDFGFLEKPVQVNFTPFPHPFSPTKRNELGLVQGLFVFQMNLNGRVKRVEIPGYFKKIEIHIQVDKPCKILKLEQRWMKHLPDHNYTKIKPNWEPDPIDEGQSPNKPEQSLKKLSDQHWILTDAPGMPVQLKPPNNLVFHKKYRIFVTFQKGNDIRFTLSRDYKVRVATDGQGQIKRQ